MGWLETFAHEYAAYGYPVLFVGVLLENAGIPVPGETAVLVAGFLASPAGGGHFHILLVILFTLVAAVIGDNVGYWLGYRWARPRIQVGRGFLFLTPRMLELAEGYFERYGVWTIFFARFITGLRVVGALAAGAAGMHWLRFFAANAAGALAWAVTMSLLGYFFGQSLHLLHRYIGWSGFLILGCVVVLVSLPLLLRRVRQRTPGRRERMFRAQVWQGILAAILEVVCVALLVISAQHELKIDLVVDHWLTSARRELPYVNALADQDLQVGSLPVILLVTCGLILEWWRLGRPGREIVAMLWALLASESVGFILLALLRRKGLEAGWPPLWPHGFAAVAPLRAFAVFGMAAYLVGRHDRFWGGVARILAAVLILLVGFSAVWTRLHTLSQVLLEYAAGGLIVFGGLWWLEGHGRLVPIPRTTPDGDCEVARIPPGQERV